MEFTSFDIGIVVTMSIAIVASSFLFPVLGLTGSNVGAPEIPMYNASNEAFDYLNDRPGIDEFPSQPREGTLTYVDNQTVYQDDRRVWLEGNSQEGVEITLTNNGTISDPAASLFLNEYDGGTFVGADSTEMENTTEFDILERANYTVTFTNVRFSNVGDADMTMQVDWEVQETPAGASNVGQIPFIGGTLAAVADAIGGIVAVIGWIGSILYFIAETISVGILGAVTVLFNALSFLLDMFFWLITTRAAIITGAPAGWVSVLLAIPDILLSLVFFKAAYIGIQTAPGLG